MSARSLATPPIATIRAYRRPGGAVVTIERPGGPKRRHCVSLRRYAALGQWVMRGPYPWSGIFGRSASSMSVSLWEPTP